MPARRPALAADAETARGGVATGLGDAVADGLAAILTSPRPDAGTVERGRAHLRSHLSSDLQAYLAAMDRFAAPLREIVAGARMADPDDRLQAVRFTLALHELEHAILAGAIDEEAVDNTVYMRYAQLEEALEAALPPRPGFTGRSQPPAPGRGGDAVRDAGREVRGGGAGTGGPSMPS